MKDTSGGGMCMKGGQCDWVSQWGAVREEFEITLKSREKGDHVSMSQIVLTRS